MANITEKLSKFFVKNSSLQIEDLHITTGKILNNVLLILRTEFLLNKMSKNHLSFFFLMQVCNASSCECEPDHSWSENVCESQSLCCGKNTCSLSGATYLRCISDKTGKYHLSKTQSRHPPSHSFWFQLIKQLLISDR